MTDDDLTPDTRGFSSKYFSNSKPTSSSQNGQEDANEKEEKEDPQDSGHKISFFLNQEMLIENTKKNITWYKIQFRFRHIHHKVFREKNLQMQTFTFKVVTNPDSAMLRLSFSFPLCP